MELKTKTDRVVLLTYSLLSFGVVGYMFYSNFSTLSTGMASVISFLLVGYIGVRYYQYKKLGTNPEENNTLETKQPAKLIKVIIWGVIALPPMFSVFYLIHDDYSSTAWGMVTGVGLSYLLFFVVRYFEVKKQKSTAEANL